MKYLLLIISSLIILSDVKSQGEWDFDGQVSFISSYSPQVDLPGFFGVRYIPEFNYKIEIDSVSSFDFEASVNVNAIYNFGASDGIGDANFTPYRLWARYSGNQFEVRAGLQKIEFGSASILRPLQWFNQVDPRDPLQLTNGVYGVLGRYYFLNNANIWVWGLYGNEKTKGFEALPTNAKVPEYGGRIQYPMAKGEIGITYHHRTLKENALVPNLGPENRIGLDGKWDVGIGLWFEVSQTWNKDIGRLNNQTALNVGFDYTFGVGNGLVFIAEHLLFSYDEKLFDFSEPLNFTAATMSYPIGFFDNLSTVLYYNWDTNDLTFFLNYGHQFKHVNAYLMAYYNPEVQGGIQQNELLYSFAGPGLRLMFVYNH